MSGERALRTYRDYTDGRPVEADGLAEGRYARRAWGSGAGPAALPPFPDLARVPASLWP